MFIYTLYFHEPIKIRWGGIAREICNVMGTAMGTPGIQLRVRNRHFSFMLYVEMSDVDAPS